MKKIVFILTGIILLAGMAFAVEDNLGMNLSTSPDPAIIGQEITLTCQATGEWRRNRISKAQASIWDASGTRVAKLQTMTVNGQTATYKYMISQNQNPGTWRFECRISDGRHTLTRSQEFTVIGGQTNHPPLANIGGPYSGTPGESISFSGSGSSDPDGDSLTYSWNFGDGGSSSEDNPSHTYAAAGNYIVTLTVNDGKGGSDSDQTTAGITVSNHPPVASVGGPYSGAPGQAISFNGSGSSDPDNDALTYSWNFGDGGSAASANPSHTYAAAGNYTVTLTVSDGRGGSDSDQTTAGITVSNHPPVASAGGPYAAAPGQAISFNGSGSSDPDGDTLTYSWNFGDGGTASTANPSHAYAAAGDYTVTLTVSDGKGGSDSDQITAIVIDPASGHASIQSYNGPATCVACHPNEAQEMLGSLHMKWSGPTPELTNSGGKELGKQVGGINTFCTYAVSSKNACYNCHVRTDGNANHPATVNEVDCLMCHSDVYQRKFVADPNNTKTVTNVLGESKTYMFTLMDGQGGYVSEPDFANMPAGTTMTSIARNVQLPTRKSCLRCHAKSGGGDWTKRGDMGVNTANPTFDQDIHMSSAGANLTCADCHAASGHRIGGRGIDLRETEAPDPKCSNCHTASPHSDSVMNRHANGQVGCQVCHIRSFGKGGATEMARDWRQPEWNAAFCNGQGGFVGLETKIPNDLPEYRFFDGTSYVYNVGETVQPNADGTYTLAKANGSIFDGKSKIVPIKDHWSTMAITTDGKIVPPVIMDMFMTGYFDQAVQAGMDEQGLAGTSRIIQADAEMLITHGVDPKSNAPSCSACHTSSGKSNLMIPFAELGYHKFLSGVESCTRCHSPEDNPGFQRYHDQHVRERHLDCTRCHTK